MHCPSLCLIVLLTLMYSESGRVSGIKVCGSRLVDLLNLVCGGKFNGPDSAQTERRSVPRSFFRRNHNIARRGVVDECCHNSCTLRELMRYCEDPTTALDLFEYETELETTEVIQKTAGKGEASPTQEPFSTTTRRPNLGLFSRNRPFFVVLPTSIMRTRQSLFSPSNRSGKRNISKAF